MAGQAKIISTPHLCWVHVELGWGVDFYFKACKRRATSSALARLLKALMRK